MGLQEKSELFDPGEGMSDSPASLETNYQGNKFCYVIQKQREEFALTKLCSLSHHLMLFAKY